MFELDAAAEMQRTDVRMQWGMRIPLRDGVELSATLYAPRELGAPAPAIFTLTPYVAQLWHEFGVYFAGHGYPFVCVDVRGRGNSQGEFQPFAHESRDGYDVVEWLAQQPYCNGQVAMWGGSYAGYAQWMTAKEFPPHLATIVPVAAAHIGGDMPMQNNISAPYVMQWLTLVSGRTSQERLFFNSELYWGAQFRRAFEAGVPFRELDTFLGNPSAIFQEWISHPEQDAYWDRRNPSAEQYAKISLPILTITGHYDSDQPGALTHYREHLARASPGSRARHFLVIGPWDHFGTRTPRAKFCGVEIGPAGLLDLQRLHVEWYGWTMGGGPKPRFLEKNVAYYVMGAERWRYADSLEAVTARSGPLYLRSSGAANDVFHSGALVEELAAQSEPDTYVYDPRDVSLAALESRIDPENRADQRMIHAVAGKALVYHSAPFEQDTEVSGFFRLEAWIGIDRPDTDFRAAVYEATPDGGAILLTFDSIRARYRESLREEKLIRTAEPLRYDFERFTFISRAIRKGSRLRLTIGPIDSIYSQKNYNSGGAVSQESMADAQPVNVMLFHDRVRPSALYIPFGS